MHDTYYLKCNAVNNTYFSPRVTVQFACEGLVESFARVNCKIQENILGYLKDSNAGAHSVDTGISQTVRLKTIENDIECPIYMLESNNYYQSLERTRGNVVLKTLVFPQ